MSRLAYSLWLADGSCDACARAPLRLTGEQLEVIEGVNVPALQKSITDHMPEGLVDTEETDAAENAEDDEYEQ
eukprot:5103346-Pleurochrysis_carterae.AAC.3